MLRSFSLSVAVVLLLSSGVFAAIGQAEGFSINALNIVQRVGGAGWAKSGNVVIVGHAQRAYAAGTAAIQKETGVVAQRARTSGLGGTTKILQNASIHGRQGQMIASEKPGLQVQGQSLAVGLDNVIRKTGGIGRAVGEQGFVGRQNQVIITPGGTGANSQFVGATQFAAVSGGPGTSVVVNNNLDVNMGQGQTVKGPYVPPKPKPAGYPK